MMNCVANPIGVLQLLYRRTPTIDRSIEIAQSQSRNQICPTPFGLLLKWIFSCVSQGARQRRDPGLWNSTPLA
jgi:hypothetical protein